MMEKYTGRTEVLALKSEPEPDRVVIAYWRGLLRVTSVRNLDDPEKGTVRVKAPGWNPRVSIMISASRIPGSILECIKQGTRMLAFMNLSAERAKDLELCDFQILPEQDIPRGTPPWIADIYYAAIVHEANFGEAPDLRLMR